MAEQNLDRMKRRRTANKKVLTGLLVKAKAGLQKEYNDDLKVELQTLLRTIQEQEATVKALDNDILNFIEDVDELETDLQTSVDFGIDVTTGITKIINFLKKNCTDTLSSSSVSSSGRKATTKLPKLTLPKFNGDSLKWKPFLDSFNIAVGENDELSGVEKMNYLRSLLTEKAEQTISGLALSNENYPIAMKLLEERFGDEQIIISSHMNKLLELPKIMNVKDITGLRILYDTAESQIRSLQAFGLLVKNYGPLLVPVILSKLPDSLKLIISQKSDSDVWDAENILKVLQKEILAREKLNTIGETASDFGDFAGLHVGGGESRKSSCVFCDGKHKSHNCRTVSNVEARKQIIRRKGLCFVCLEKGHLSKNCRRNFTCFKCGKKHHTSLCFGKKTERTENKPAADTEDQGTEKANNDKTERTETAESTTSGVTGIDLETVNLLSNSDQVLLQTAEAVIFSKGVETNCRILFDLGSQLSCITPEARNALNLETTDTKRLSIKVFGGSHSVKELDRVEFTVKAKFGHDNVNVSAFVNEVCKPLSGQNIDLAKSKFSHLQGLSLADGGSGKKKIDILIGADNYWKFFKSGVVQGENGGPVASSSILGFILSGPINNSNNALETNSTMIETFSLKVAVEEEKSLLKEFKRFNDLETIGIVENEKDCVLEEFEKSIEFKNNRYEVRLPFKENRLQLNDNYELSRKRLYSNWNKLKNNESLLKNYNEIFEQQLKDGIIEKAGHEKPNEVHYLPHHGVENKSSTTTKLRIVFDASAKTHGSPSLNQSLHTGPSLTPSLFGVLLRFRAHNVALTGDIEKAFHQISIHPDDRDYMRFLWFKDPFKLDKETFENNELIEYRFCRVLMGATPSPFLLSATLQEHMQRNCTDEPELASKFLESIHVDDLTTGAEGDSAAFEFYDNCKTKLKKGGFNLRKFKSNSKNLESWIVKDFGSNELEKGEQTKVLGVSWNKADDKLCFDFDELLQNQIEPVTKRNVMHFIASIYDPLGLINPVVVTMKCFLKELFKEKLGWDEPLPETLKSRWISILKDLENCKIEIDRLYSLKEFEDPFVSVQLHGFSDASKVAYGASMYLRFVYNSGKIKVVLIAGKSRVKPDKVKSIPRLELLGTLLISRLAQTVREELSSVFTLDDRTHLWTDSSCAYCWIINEDKVFKRFVENRVCKIRKLTESACWHLVPSKSNSADIISKGSSPGELGDLWFRGPKFLALPETSWPQLLPGDKFDEYKEEVKPVIALSAPATEIDLRELIPPTRYNSFLKLIRVTAWVMRFIRNIRKKKEEGRLPTNNNNQNGPWLSAKELTDTRKLWIKHEQLSIKNLNDVGRNLGTYLDDDGLIRCRGRLDNANLTFNEKYPYLLPSGRLAQTIVYDVHTRIKHAGVRDTLVELRQEFWIPKGRNFVRKALFDCNTCKRVNAKPYAYPEPPSLPVDRVTGTTAFKNIGIDYAGPLHVKNIFGDDEELYKAWISVATCTSSRGVHLDLAADASADECVEILRRFIARHGAPDSVGSDHGTNFVSETVQNFASSRNIDWKFTIEAAPWMGGFWERLVQSVKRPLRKVLSNTTLRYNEVLTILMEIEAMINNRPLTYVYPEMDEALTPNHLIFGRRINTVAEKVGDSTAKVEKRVQYLETLLEHFWNRWNKEYLTELREHWQRKRTKRQPIARVNDIVLIMDDKLARSKWRVGIIEKLIHSNDGQIRAATVRTVTETGRISYLRRPVNKLVPLEVSDEEDEIHRREIKFVDEEKMKFILPYTPGH